MPFQEITTVVHTGRVRPSEQFAVVLTNRTSLVFGVTYGRSGQKRFRLERSTWPKAVRDAVAALANEQGRKGRPPDMGAFEAFVANDKPLAKEQRVLLTIEYGGHTTISRDVELRGTIKRFVFDD